uniref:Protein SPIRAL1-like 5 n=1 Tax=Picea sitchensis TaxID=3332 RepID=B8LQ89_PICSI|nr:unknown [Picea sitchensis]
MGRGVSSGGGQSSLGYLFGSAQPSKTQPTQGNPINTQSLAPNNSPMTNPEASSSSGVCKTSNNYHRADGQNSGNFITGRPSTKVQSVPGGGSSLGYLFGEKK